MPQIGARLGGSHVLLQQQPLLADANRKSIHFLFGVFYGAGSRARRIGGALERLAQITFACRPGRRRLRHNIG